jgi:AhpD family alkylhydroperoxidase
MTGHGLDRARADPSEGGNGGGEPHSQSRLDKELADAIYYLQHGCEPCAERHFHLARRLGASEEQIASAVAASGR